MNSLLLCLSIAFLLGAPGRAWGKISDELLEALPSPINYLNSVDFAGEALQQGLLSSLSEECHQFHRGCEVPSLIAKYNRLLGALKTGQSGVVVSATRDVKAWDLSAILAGQFLILPNAKDANAGKDLMVEIFLTRDRIVRAIATIYKLPPNQPFISPIRRLSGLFLQAYVMTSSPFGALDEVFSGLHCDIKDPSCEILKSLWGAVCNIAVQNHAEEFNSFERRLNAVMSEESSQGLGRLKLVQGLHDYVEKGSLERETLLLKLAALEGDGLAGYTDADYADLALSVLVYNELSHLMKLAKSCTSYGNELSLKTRALYQTQLNSITQKNLENIKNALVKYGVINESGGL